MLLGVPLELSRSWYVLIVISDPPFRRAQCSFSLLIFSFLNEWADEEYSGNIGNSKVLNAETGDDLLQQTGMSNSGYALTVTLFSIAYTLFEVPSNWIMKHWVRPSVWLGFLLAAWGVLTIGYVCVAAASLYFEPP